MEQQNKILKEWWYKDNKITDIKDISKILNIKNPKDLYGFVYELDFPNNMKYIGKKNFYNFKTQPTKRSGLPREGHIKFFKRRVDHHNKEFELFKTESDWLSYQGSSSYTTLNQVVKKTILDVTKSKRYLTYLEAKYLFSKNAIEDINYLNDNILGVFFRNRITKEEDNEDWEQVLRDIGPCSIQ